MAGDDAGERPLGLRERKKRQTRERIVQAARELFSERGYESATVAEIAAGADISVPTLFTYFAAKEDIFFSDYEAARADAAAVHRGAPPGSVGARVAARVGTRVGALATDTASPGR